MSTKDINLPTRKKYGELSSDGILFMHIKIHAGNLRLIASWRPEFKKF